MSIEQNTYCGPYLLVTKLEQDQTLDRLVDMGVITQNFLDTMLAVKFENNAKIVCYIPNLNGITLEHGGETCIDLCLVDMAMEKEMFMDTYHKFIQVMSNESAGWDMCYGILRWYN